MVLPKSTVQNVISEQSEILLPKTLPQELVDRINSALAEEYTAHYFYRAAANWCQGVAYIKAAAFFEAEASTELEHAVKLQKYLVDWNCTPQLPTVKFSGEFASLIDIVNKAYAIEYKLGDKYNEMSAEIFAKHLPTFDFLQEFRTIQTESIAEYSDKLNAAQLIDVSNKLDLLHYEERYF
jgi:ferritin